MMLAARHPDLFAAAASMSGAVDSNLPANGAVLSASSTFDGAPADAIYGPRASQEVRWRGHNPTDLAANLRDVDLQVRTADGTPNPGIGEDPLSADPSRARSRAASTRRALLPRDARRARHRAPWRTTGRVATARPTSRARSPTPSPPSRRPRRPARPACALRPPLDRAGLLGILGLAGRRRTRERALEFMRAQREPRRRRAPRAPARRPSRHRRSTAA